jgi:RNA polymerase sigma-70 factor, ECF subfamily
MDSYERFLQLFLKSETDLKAFIGSLVRDFHARDDVFQEVSLTLWKSFEHYDPERPFGAWARGIAGNKVMQYYARLKRDGQIFNPEVIEAISKSWTESDPSISDMESILQTCIEKLTQRSKQLLVLRYEKSFRLDDISQQIKSTIEAVHKALTRARTQLRECVEYQILSLKKEDV